MVKNDCPACDNRRHPGDSAHEEVERNFPRPNRRSDHGLTVVTGLARNWATGNIDTFAGNDALLPRLLAQLFESLFGWRVRRHEKNAEATRVAMIDEIPVDNPALSAD